MKTVAIALTFIATITLTLPCLANDPDIDVFDGPQNIPHSTPKALFQTPLQQTISEIKQEAIESVQDLNNELFSAASGSVERKELILQIHITKKNCEIAILQAVAADARDRGDRKTKLEAEHALDQLQHPENYPVETFPSNRPVPNTR